MPAKTLDILLMTLVAKRTEILTAPAAQSGIEASRALALVDGLDIAIEEVARTKREALNWEVFLERDVSPAPLKL